MQTHLMPPGNTSTNDIITRRHEEQLHTYAPLFSPPTPRGSPTPPDDETDLRKKSYRASAAIGIGGGLLGMGGVVVQDMQDPLSMVSDEHSGEEILSTLTGSDSLEHPSPSLGATGNSTLAFFDNFVSQARAASEIKRKNVLDEILLHQDDPLFRWSDTAATASTSDDVGEIASGVNDAVGVTGNDDSGADTSQVNGAENTGELTGSGAVGAAPFADLRTPSPTTIPDAAVEHPTHRLKRSPTLHSLQPTTLAPPLESTDTASAATTPILPDSSSSSFPFYSNSPSRSPYATLSGLHSRWMSSIHHHDVPVRPSTSPSPPPTHTHMPSSNFVSSSLPTKTSLTFPRTITRPHTFSSSNPLSAHTRPSSSSHALSSSFGSTLPSHTPSPFASHVSAPISGAPGFMEERYDWDKGFSDELIEELEDVNKDDGAGAEEFRDVKNENKDDNNTADTTTTTHINLKLKSRVTTEAKENVGNGTTTRMQMLIAGSGISKISKKDKEKDTAIKHVRAASSFGGSKHNEKHIWNETLKHSTENGNEASHHHHDGRLVSDLIEKKLGSVELKGRKEMTSPVLDVILANLLRTHLPALDRLPKSWTLIYSLDQHGISLNTLYTRCEAHTLAQAQSQSQLGGTTTRRTESRIIGAGTGRPGVLVVVKDSGDGLFGVWMGDGIKQSRGKGYYGSGESFMWRYWSNPERDEKELVVYKWTGKNKYIALCEPDYISFGGGEGQYGLYLDETLFEGSSARCSTFGNDPLCSPGANKGGAVSFECVGLEVWGIGA